MMEPDQQLRNLRDFLLVYNRMTEICFQRCSSNFNYRNLTMDEDRCVDNCAGKLIRANHRLMGTYVQLMPKMVQKRMDEMQSKAEEAEAAAAAAAGAAVGSVTEAPITTEFSIDQTSQLPPPSYTFPADTDAGPGQHLGVPGLESSPTLVQMPQSNMAAAVPVTPATVETVISPQVDNMVLGPASAVVSPLPGNSVSTMHATPFPVASITPSVVPVPSIPTVPVTSIPIPARPEGPATDASTISKA